MRNSLNYTLSDSLELYLAEREGFEPPDLLQSTVFKTAAIDHSAISPLRMYTQKGFERLSIRFWMECGKECDPKKGWNRVLPMGWIPARLGPHHFN